MTCPDPAAQTVALLAEIDDIQRALLARRREPTARLDAIMREVDVAHFPDFAR